MALALPTTAVGHYAMARASEASDRATGFLVLLAVILGAAWVFVLLRVYVRFFITPKIVAADDWWMFAAMLAYTGYSFDAMYGILFGGTGRHMAELTTEEIYIGLKCWYISEILYAPVSAMVRTSVGLFLLRVSVDPCHKWVIIANLSVIYLITIIFMFVVTFQCSPPSYFYEQAIGLEGSCMAITVVPYATIAHSAIGAVCDLVFASLPIAMLWNVQLNKRTKVVVALLLGMGFVAGIALLVRIPFVKILAVTPDFLFETIDVAIWSVLEPSLGIMTGCLATMRPLFRRFGIGRNTTHGYLEGYVSASSRVAPSIGRQRSHRFNKTGDIISPFKLDMNLVSTDLGDSPGSTHSSTRPLTLRLESLTLSKPSVETNIVSTRDPSAAFNDVEESGARSISVYTTIRTQSIYEDVQPMGS